MVKMNDTKPEAATTFKRTIFGREIAFTVRGDGGGVAYTYPNVPPYGYVSRMTRMEALRVIALSVRRMRRASSGQGVGLNDIRLGSFMRSVR